MSRLNDDENTEKFRSEETQKKGCNLNAQYFGKNVKYFE